MKMKHSFNLTVLRNKMKMKEDVVNEVMMQYKIKEKIQTMRLRKRKQLLQML